METPLPTVTSELLSAAAELRDAVDQLTFAEPVALTYNPLVYAWNGYAAYLQRFATGPRRTVFLGMNPGPFGMTQTGVPFGEISAVRDWMGIDVPIGQPPKTHPKRPVEGFACPRSEVSGRRLWRDLFAVRYPNAADFFREHLVLNYCPLVFMTATGANYTPDKLRVEERAVVDAACQRHLRRALAALAPEHVVGVGAYARRQLEAVLADGWEGFSPKISSIIHPAPASPIANREWPHRPSAELCQSGVWNVTF